MNYRDILDRIQSRGVKERLTVSIAPDIAQEFRRICGDGNVSGAIEELMKDFVDQAVGRKPSGIELPKDASEAQKKLLALIHALSAINDSELRKRTELGIEEGIEKAENFIRQLKPNRSGKTPKKSE